MVHVGYHRHVTDVVSSVHDGPDLFHCEVHLSIVGKNVLNYYHRRWVGKTSYVTVHV